MPKLATLAAVIAALSSVTYAANHSSPLDQYVNAPDPHYHYDLVSSVAGKGYTAYVLDMTSQQWRSESEVNHTIWKHWVTIVRPDDVKTETGLLFITGGTVNQKAPTAGRDLIDMAMNTHSVVAELRGIPNEPLVFSDDQKVRTEDGIVVYTWVKFLKTGDSTWPLRMPMTKASARAMDTVTDFCASPKGGKVKVTKFVVAGASKRGLTTWMTAAVDPRVVAIVPMVIDLLNTKKSFEHHLEAYGSWGAALKDYEGAGVLTVSSTPQYDALMKLEDPYTFRDRFTMPKLMLNAAGDQFFLPDSSQFYFDGLPGEKYLRYVPNVDHGLKGDARETLAAFYDMFLRGQPRPRFTWKFAKNGDIQVITKDQPTEVKLWAATNPEKRDFRLESIGPAYKETVLTAAKSGQYIGHVEKPAKGWTAYFVELTFPSGGKYPLKVTTAVRVTPDTLPYPPPASNGKIEDLK